VMYHFTFPFVSISISISLSFNNKRNVLIGQGYVQANVIEGENSTFLCVNRLSIL